MASETTRIDISDGDWIDVKKHLNIGEQLEVEGSGIVLEQKPGEREATWKMQSAGEAAVARMFVWLADWSFENANGRKVPLSKATVAQLDEDTFGEVRTAIDKHSNADKGASTNASDTSEPLSKNS